MTQTRRILANQPATHMAGFFVSKIMCAGGESFPTARAHA